MNLSRYYDAPGTYQVAAKNNEKALAIHKKLGDEKAVLTRTEQSGQRFTVHILPEVKRLP